MQRKLYLAAYDIACNRRRRQALAVAREYALDGQKSVFECWLSRQERQALEERLVALIDPRKDHVFILPLDLRGVFRSLGTAQVPTTPQWLMVA